MLQTFQLKIIERPTALLISPSETVEHQKMYNDLYYYHRDSKLH